MSVIAISVQEYGELVQAQIMLDCLIEAGVDNWEGWSHAMELLREHDESN
jgi:hypothetical protein